MPSFLLDLTKVKYYVSHSIFGCGLFVGFLTICTFFAFLTDDYEPSTSPKDDSESEKYVWWYERKEKIHRNGTRVKWAESKVRVTNL